MERECDENGDNAEDVCKEEYAIETRTNEWKRGKREEVKRCKGR